MLWPEVPSVLIICCSIDTFGTPSNAFLLFMNVSQYLPAPLLLLLMKTVPSPGLRHVKEASAVARSVAKSLLEKKSAALLGGEGNRDVMSLIGE